MRRLLIAVAVLPLCCTGQLAAQVYSYVDENGVRVLTNIPPTQPTAGLELRVSAPPGQNVAKPAANAGTPAKPVRRATSPARFAASKPPAGLTAPQFDPIIEKYSLEHRLDPGLVKSIIATESGFNPTAVSRAGAQGLMQLMPATASRLGVRDSFDAEENIRGGTKHLRSLLDIFDNDLVLSLAAYNAGENLVQRIKRVPNFKETHDYVRLVTSRYGKMSMDPFDAVATAQAPPKPIHYRFLDRNGVLHLTNIPPSQRVDYRPESVRATDNQQ